VGGLRENSSSFGFFNFYSAMIDSRILKKDSQNISLGFEFKPQNG